MAWDFARLSMEVFWEEGFSPKHFRCTGVNHNTVIQWVKQSGKQLADAAESQMIPELAPID